MNQDRAKVSSKRSATEYRLSITSNPGSRRSSLGGINYENTSSNSNNRPGSSNSVVDDKENFVKEYILPQIREFSDSMITLDANFTQLNFIHESLVDLNESLGSLLYGLMCNSWCVDFPHVSHDVAEELKLANKLESLAQEKRLLLQQLATLKDETKFKTNKGHMQPPTSGPSTQIKPSFTTEPARPNQFPNHESHLMSETELDNDDNTSEASFVSNPGVDTPARRFKGNNNVTKQEPTKTTADRMRRKSILHTIRNSLATTSDFNTKASGPVDSRKPSRASLAGGATRIVSSRPPTDTSTNMAINGHPARMIAHTSASNSSAKLKKIDSINKRPPFR